MEKIGEDIIGLDANVLVDLVESGEFKEEIKNYVEINVLKICTTNVALGEARHVLIKKRNYDYNKATDSLNKIINQFNIEVIRHKVEFNILADKWVNNLRGKMYFKEFKTLPNDCRILSNLYSQARINIYITEDLDIEKAVKILNLPIQVKIIGEASNISGQKISQFFKENRKDFRKKYKPY